MAARRARLKPPAVGQAYRPGGAAPAVDPAAALAARLGCGQRRTHRGERGAVRSEERDVGAQIGRELLERRLLLGPWRARGRQRVLRERRRHFVGLAPWAVVAERPPEQARGESERGETREHREIDAQVKAAHQSCALANR